MAALGEAGDGTRRSSSPQRGLQGRHTLLDGLLGRGFGRSPWVGAEAAPAGSDRGVRAQGAGVASRAALPNVATVTWLASVVPVHGDRAVGYRVLASWAEGGTAARRDLSS